MRDRFWRLILEATGASSLFAHAGFGIATFQWIGCGLLDCITSMRSTRSGGSLVATLITALMCLSSVANAVHLNEHGKFHQKKEIQGAAGHIRSGFKTVAYYVK